MFSNRTVWIALVLLTLLGLSFSESLRPSPGFNLYVLSLYGMKIFAIGLKFMELKDAHPFWRILLSGLVVFFVVSFSAIY